MAEPQHKSTSALFQVYLRLRPPPQQNQLYPNLTQDRFLTVEVPKSQEEDALPTHIILNPPNDNRRRAVEKFGFTKVFEEDSSQLDLFQGTGVIPLVEGVLGCKGSEGRDGLLATLGVTGSGKSHTILGSKSQRGLTQLALDLLFRSLGSSILDPTTSLSLLSTLAASDPSEAQVLSTQGFLETLYGDMTGASRGNSRAATPMRVRFPEIQLHPSSIGLYPIVRNCSGQSPSNSPKSIRIVPTNSPGQPVAMTSRQGRIPSFMTLTTSQVMKQNQAKSTFKGESIPPPTPSRRNGLHRPSVLPHLPDITSITVTPDSNAEYAIVISMYEVYNDRIFDLLTPPSRTASTKDFRRRPLLYKHTEHSPDRKVVAGLRKVICGNVREAIAVLEAGLQERRVAGTGSNSVSSRSHGFFCVEVKKRRKGRFAGPWGGSALTIVDLAGSERARDAKTQGATLAEAGKINESLMYLGQCLQMQSDLGSNTKPNLVPFRQCKLTELLFSNSFPSASSLSNSTSSSSNQTPHAHRNPQKAIMIVTADPVGDFNATSQMLRYSALAREITVPRIPSITSTILATSTPGARSYFDGHTSRGGRSTPSESERETMEIAALEIARMSEEIDGLRAELLSEVQRRLESDAHLASAEERLVELEADVREECWLEMESRMKIEMTKWKATWAAEQDRNDEHVDRKLEILTRGIEVPDESNKENFDYDGAANAKGKVEDLEGENERLRMRVSQLQREVQGRSPSKKSVLGESRIGMGMGSKQSMEDMGRGIEKMRLGSSGDGNLSPTKKMRKLTARKWDIADEEDLL